MKGFGVSILNQLDKISADYKRRKLEPIIDNVLTMLAIFIWVFIPLVLTSALIALVKFILGV